MLRKEQMQISEYEGLYDRLIPQNHFLRRMNDLVDFSFVVDELKSKYCLDKGRGAEPPIRLFKYLLLKCLYPMSDVDLVERSMYDMSFKYFLILFRSRKASKICEGFFCQAAQKT